MGRDWVLHLIRKVAQLLRWRFFFFQTQNTSFTSLTLLDKYLRVFEVPVRQDFREYLRELIDDWSSYQRTQTAVAGA